MIRKALSGREVEPAIAFRVILYTYCSVFHVDPAIAQNSPMKLMMEMLQVHSEVEPSIAFRVILYSYCKTFSISPAEAQHTTMKLMVEMLQIHSEVESMKNREMEKEVKKHEQRK